MKRFLTVLVLLTLLVVALAMPANAATSGKCGDNATWDYMDGTLSITGTGAVYDYTGGSYTPWYSLRSQIDSVYVDEGITDLGDYNFDGLSAAVTILLPSTLKTIGNYTFRDCKVVDELDLPGKLTTIGLSAFHHCDSLTKITIPASVTNLGNFAFEYCGALKEIKFMGNVPTIGENAFRTGKSKLTVYYPGTNTTWTDDVMQDYGITDKTTYIPFYMTVASGAVTKTINWELNDAGVLTISGTGVMPDYDMTSQQPWYSKSSSIKSLVIKSGITQVGKYNFAFCENIEKITFADTVTMIGERAFYRLDSIKTLTIPGNIATLDYGAFDSCKLLESVIFGNGVKEIGYYAFCDCVKLTQVTFNGDAPAVNGAFRTRSSSLTVKYPGTNATWTEEAMQNYGYDKTIVFERFYHIEEEGKCGDNISWIITRDRYLILSGTGPMYDYSFEGPDWGLTNMEHLIVEEGITTIGDNAFRTVSSLQTAKLPEGLTSIGYQAFERLQKLTSVNIPSTVTTIEGRAFNACRALAEVTIPEGVTTIAPESFTYCNALKKLTIPDSVTSVGNFAFEYCDSIEQLELGSGVTSFEYSAFAHCSALKSVTIPQSVINIGEFAFYNCTALTEITFEGDAPQIKNNSFMSVKADVYYSGANTTWNEETKLDYSGTLTWNPVYTVIASGACGNNATWTLDDTGLLTITGTGMIEKNTSWNGNSLIKSVLIGDGITEISDNTFYDFNSMTSLTIGNGVSNIGDYAFVRCYNLTDVYISDPNAWCKFALVRVILTLWRGQNGYIF